jgi:predicted enzyme related to lactoylglutathione lyase
MSNRTKSKPKSKSRVPASIVWFEIPADNVARAKAFYSKLFGWKIKKFPGPMKMPYWHIDTGGSKHSLDGGLLPRQAPQHRVTNYILVDSVDRAAARVMQLGGSIVMPKSAVPRMGYFVICLDTEDNPFALWEKSDSAQ